MTQLITEYMTVKECQAVCRFKGPEPIRRAIYRGELPAVRVRANRLLIPATAFWDWFHARDVKPRMVKEVDIPVLKPIRKAKLKAEAA